MPNYVVNTNPQTNGDHEVHDTATCTRLPQPQHQLTLGWHASCLSAVVAAKKVYWQSNGCYYCSPACHTS